MTRDRDSEWSDDAPTVEAAEMRALLERARARCRRISEMCTRTLSRNEVRDRVDSEPPPSE